MIDFFSLIHRFVGEILSNSGFFPSWRNAIRKRVHGWDSEFSSVAYTPTSSCCNTCARGAGMVPGRAGTIEMGAASGDGGHLVYPLALHQFNVKRDCSIEVVRLWLW